MHALLGELDKLDEPDRWEAPRRVHQARTTRRVATRRRATSLGLGVRGRVAWTAGVALAVAAGLAMLSSTVLGRIGVGMFLVFVAPGAWIVLSAVWRTRYHVETVEPDRRCRVCAWGLDAEMPACPRCGAAAD